MKTYSAKPSEVKRTWYILDASQASLGRLSTQAARLLLGKDKPMLTRHIDCGDYVIVINAEKLVVTGKKLKDKIYYRHTKYPGGLKSLRLEELMEKDPALVISGSVRGMLPVNKLRDGRLKRLKVYTGETHEHEAQKPVKYDMKRGK